MQQPRDLFPDTINYAGKVLSFDYMVDEQKTPNWETSATWIHRRGRYHASYS